jgi:hypothetical protein
VFFLNRKYVSNAGTLSAGALLSGVIALPQRANAQLKELPGYIRIHHIASIEGPCFQRHNSGN